VEEGAPDYDIDIGPPLLEDERELRCHDPATDDEEVFWQDGHRSEGMGGIDTGEVDAGNGRESGGGSRSQ